MKKNFFEKKTGLLTEAGKNELQRLESVLLPTMRKSYLDRYLNYSDVEKMRSLIAKSRREEKKETPTSTEKRMTIMDYLQSNPPVDWLNYDINALETLEGVFTSYLDDIKTAKDLLLTEKYEQELANLIEQRSDLDSKIVELQSFLGVAS